MNKRIERLIGYLLIIPIYLIVIIILEHSHILTNTSLLLPILMYIPILIGIVISFIFNKNKFSKILSIIIILFCIISFYNYYDTYFIEHKGLTGLSPFVYWILTSIIIRLLTIILYIKNVGFKKTLPFIITYIISILFGLFCGFWE